MSNRIYNKQTMKKSFWYKNKPDYHSRDVDSLFQDWDKWHAETKQEYPIQYFFRETLIDWIYNLKRNLRDIKWGIIRFFNPHHKELRKAIPRQWADISQLIIDVNFAMILSFKKEADASCVNWSGTDGHRKFKNWLDSAANWVEEGLPNLQKQLDNAYPPYPLPEYLKNKSYEDLYSEVNRIEKLIDTTNTNILKQMIDYREYMWT